jgi:hypothetical protein
LRFELRFTPRAEKDLRELEFDQDKKDLIKLKKVRKCLGLLQQNPRHPGLKSHDYESLEGPNGEHIWESYVESVLALRPRQRHHHDRRDYLPSVTLFGERYVQTDSSLLRLVVQQLSIGPVTPTCRATTNPGMSANTLSAM